MHAGSQGGSSGLCSLNFSSGRSIPFFGYGTWDLYAETRRLVGVALDQGYRLIDTATIYKNERDVGLAIRDSGIDRGSVTVTTKLAPGNVGCERRALETSLHELSLDYIDLWLVHWPSADRVNVETWREFISAQRDGLVRDIGVSNYSLKQLDLLYKETGVQPVVNQIEWRPQVYDASVAEGHKQRGVVIEAYSPLRLSNLDNSILAKIAQKYGKSVAQIIVRWHLQSGFAVLTQSISKERIRENVSVLDFELDSTEMMDINSLDH